MRFTKSEFEAIWAKESTADNWTEVFSELAVDADCNRPIIRVVRFDDSGTSFAFKDYLDAVNPSRAGGWLNRSPRGRIEPGNGREPSSARARIAPAPQTVPAERPTPPTS